MTILFFLALFIFVVVCAILVGLIMMQEGKGGGLSGVMGSSMGETFGFGGASKQIRKYTSICATIFLGMTIVLTYLGEAALKTTATQFVGDTSAVPAAPAANPGAPVNPAAPAAAPTGEAPATGDAAAPRVITITPAAGGDASPGVVVPAKDPNAGPSVPSAPPAGTPAATPAP